MGSNFSPKSSNIKNLDKNYYSFSTYVSKERMITFWYQINEVLKCKSKNILEIGAGPGVVSSVLKNFGLQVTIIDINKKLNPDICVSVHNLDKVFNERYFDCVLCARVLHHIPFSEFENAIYQIWKVTNNKAILTLPVDDLRIYFSFKITSRPSIIKTISIPLLVKKTILKLTNKLDNYYYKLWKVNSQKSTSFSRLKTKLDRLFVIDRVYRIPEDMSHCVFVLTKKY